ncbi:MAG: TonB family protein [Leptospiraceae bacterium]|nr:TonB family protein [Leptospiraceae bacterium]MCP5512622.1 TonB family protein [Leptospiraceae bacterium]
MQRFLISWKFSLGVSLILHLLILLPAFIMSYEEESKEEFSFLKGVSFTIRSSSGAPSQKPILPSDSGDKSQEASESQMEGTIQEEIHSIQNSIHYPPDALEQELESECEWEVIVGSEKKMKDYRILKPCKYKIFEEEFDRVIKTWKFKSPDNAKLKIPIRFRMER